MREDRHAQLGGAQGAQRVEALREGVHHHRPGAELDYASGSLEQRVDRTGDIRGVTHACRRDGAHAFLERTPVGIAEQLVVLDEVRSARGQAGGNLRNLGR